MGLIRSVLKQDELDRLKRIIAQIKEVGTYSEHIHGGIFWSMKKEKSGSMVYWLLNEYTPSHIAKDRNHIDSFEIINANFMVCNFAFPS